MKSVLSELLEAYPESPAKNTQMIGIMELTVYDLFDRNSLSSLKISAKKSDVIDQIQP